MHSSYHICMPHMYVTHTFHKETYIYHITYIHTDIQYSGTYHMPPAHDAEYIPYICKHHRNHIHIHTILKHIVFNKSPRKSHPFQSFVCVCVVYTDVCIYSCVETHSCAGGNGCVCVCLVWRCVCTFICMQTQGYMQVYKNMCACVCVCRSDSSLILLSSYSEPDCSHINVLLVSLSAG